MNEDGRHPWDVTAAELYDALAERLDGDEPTVVATIVDVEGSAYRRPGAKMVLTPDGENLGAITAGCLEGPVGNLARSVFDGGEPVVETFDLTDDDAWGVGMGCNGVLDVLLEPLDASWRASLDEIGAKRSVAVLTAVESSDPDIGVGDRTVLDADGGRIDRDGGDRTDASDRPELPADVVASLETEAREFQRGGRSAVETVATDGGEVTVFVDGVEPVPDLLLFGHQNDVHSVARLGRTAGFRVVVASTRGAKAKPERFPNADEVVSVRPNEIAEVLDAPAHTYAVLMSHNFVDDRLALAELLETDVPYVGLMGPRKRFEEIREAFAEEGEPLPEAELSRVATPVGLDLGGGEPAQIALSIVSEALAVKHGRSGGRLVDRAGTVHARPEVDQ